MKYSLEKLLSKLRSLLIPSKIGEVVTLYDAFRVSGLSYLVFLLFSSILHELKEKFYASLWLITGW